MVTAGGHARARRGHAEETYRAGARALPLERRWSIGSDWQKTADGRIYFGNGFYSLDDGVWTPARGAALDRIIRLASLAGII